MKILAFAIGRFVLLISLVGITCFFVRGIAHGAEERPLTRPICFLGLCAKQDRNFFETLKAFERMHGRGAAAADWARCYVEPKTGRFLRLGLSDPVQYAAKKNVGAVITELFLTDVKNCTSANSIKGFPEPALLNGLGIGDALDSVIEHFGKPSARTEYVPKGFFASQNAVESTREDRAFGDAQLLYRATNPNDSLALRIFLRGNRVSGILLSLSP